MSSQEKFEDKESTTDRKNSKPTCLQKASNVLTGNLEKVFYLAGVAIAKRPAVTIGVFATISVLSLIGMINFYEMGPYSPKWTDPNSEYMRDKSWVDEKFPTTVRVNSYLVEAKDNILSPDTLIELNKIHHYITAEVKEDFELHCFKVGKTDDAPCYSTGILELWRHDSDIIAGLTEDDIKLAINTTKRSPVTGAPFDIDITLGEIVRDDDGMIVGAKAVLMSYVMQGNLSLEEEDDLITEWVEDWESEFISHGLEYNGQHISAIYVNAHKTIVDAYDATIDDSRFRLIGGYVLLVLYVSLIYGKFNCVEQRTWLALTTILGVGFSMAIAIGIGSAVGLGYNSVISLLPFLLLGFGVDDGFVIMQCWNQLSPKQKLLPLTEQTGIALKNAGVSITVTSITDFIAFGVGASTIIPALRGFCIFAAIGILAVFFAQSSFLVACIVIEERRRLSKRNALCACYRHGDDYKPISCSQKELQQSFFDNILGTFLLKLPVKVVVLVASLGLLGCCIYGAINLETEYDPSNFRPNDYYLNDYLDKREIYFPDMGFFVTGHIYLGELDYFEDTNKLENMVTVFRSKKFVNSAKVDFWIFGFKEWLETTNCPWVQSQLNSTTNWPLDKEKFNMLLKPYVYMTSHGPRHLSDIIFKDTVDVDLASVHNYTINSPGIQQIEEDLQSQLITASRIPFEYKEIRNTDERIAAMDESREVILAYYPVDKAFSYSIIYYRWETDKIIQIELYRNLGMVSIAILVLILLLIADIVTCLLVLFSTLSALIEIGGFMYFWNVPIELGSSILLIIAVGFTVDYSAHIGHTFMTVTGTRNERARKTIGEIGPAVFNSGFSMFLAIIFLSFPRSDLFIFFFKINLFVIIFGLWNGLVLLPVLLSWMGPKPYLSATECDDKDSEVGTDNKVFDSSDEKISMNAGSMQITKKSQQGSVHNSPAKISVSSHGIKHSSNQGSRYSSNLFLTETRDITSQSNMNGLPDIA